MSSSTVVPPTAPFHQWQNFYSQPYTDGYNIHEQLLVGVTGIAEQSKQQAANDIARDLIRAVDGNGMQNMHSTERNAAILAANIERASALNASTTERVNSQLATAVERNGANNMSTTERVNGQLATAVERNGANGMSTTQLAAAQLASAIERNGSNNQWATERTAGESRLTTVVTDAASRQFANDSARDITKNIDHYGMLNMGTTKDAQSLILGSIERNAGESRIQTLTSSGILGTALTDVRHSVLNDVNRSSASVIDTLTNGFNVAVKATTDSAWEQRTAAAAGFSHLGEEHLRTKQDITKSVSDSYASMLLEQQKMGQYLASKEDNHFAINQLEMQKVKEGLACQAATQHASSQLEAQKVSQFLASKADGHFAMNQLELHKVKESITAQAAQNFAANQLEQQKIREHLSNQLADAKYEQLKSQQFLADKLCECCCTIKEKVDSVKEHASVIDRDRLRDNLTVTRDEANMLKLNEYNQLYWNQNRFGGRGGFGGFDGPWGGRNGYDGYGGYGNVYNNFEDRRDDRRRGDRRGDDHHGHGDHH
jgi:hypothetical protein